MSPRASIIEGPAKWAAVAVLGSAGLIGVARSFLVETVHAPPAAPLAEPVRIDAGSTPAAADTRRAAPSSPAAPAADSEATPLSDEDDIAVRINVNTASAAELDLLPGIGPAYAERIIDERAANGPFDSVDDLQRVRGIGPKTAAKLEPLVSFGER